MPHAHHAAAPESFWIAGALTLTALIYLRGWIRIRKFNQDAIAAWRAACFLIGILLIWIAVASPLAALHHELLTAHMAQHLLLMTFAAPLIWLGSPRKPFAYGLPQRFVLAIAPLQRSPHMQRLGKALTNPIVCWSGSTAALVGWHVPAIFMIAMQSARWHEIASVSFFATGLLFWWPVVSAGETTSKSPEWSLIVYLFLATLPCDILSGFLVFCDRVVYPVYLSSSQPFGFSALEDQQCAGALMWTCVTVAYLMAGAIFTMRLLSPRGLSFVTPARAVQQSTEVL